MSIFRGEPQARTARALRVLCWLLLVWPVTANADGIDTPRRAPALRETPVYARLPRPWLVPACVHVRPRLLHCAPQLYIPDSYPGVPEALDGPPRREPRPYPSIFSWPYGP